MPKGDIELPVEGSESAMARRKDRQKKMVVARDYYEAQDQKQRTGKGRKRSRGKRR